MNCLRGGWTKSLNCYFHFAQKFLVGFAWVNWNSSIFDKGRLANKRVLESKKNLHIVIIRL